MPGASRTKTTTRCAAPAKKSVAKKAPAKKSVAKKAPAKKSVAKKVAPKKSATPKKAPPKKVAKTKSVAKPAKAPAKTATKAPAKAAAPVKADPPKPDKAAVLSKITAARLPGVVADDAGTKPVAVKKGNVICELSGFEVTPSKPVLSDKTLEKLKQKLVEEKQRLIHQAEELTAEAEQLAAEREAGDTQFDEESGEGDTVNVERERDLLLSAKNRQVVEEIDEALARMKKHSYGVCKYAGRKLPLERLEAIPYANVCVDCKARAERRR